MKVEDIEIKLNVYKDSIPLKTIRVKPYISKGLKVKINYEYLWTVNGVEQENKLYILKTTSLKKGDTIVCRVFPSHKKLKLKDIKTGSIIIPNSPPKIKYNPVGKFIVPGIFKYQIEADDPDEDEITYELLEPLDMNIMLDSISGEITWDISESLITSPENYEESNEEGSGRINKPVDTKQLISYIKIKFKVIDSDGAFTVGEVELDLKNGKEIES